MTDEAIHGSVPDKTPEAKADASNRAWRSLAQGLLIDVAVAALIVLTPAVTALEWTSEYWWGLAALVGKSVITAFVSYFARLLMPPATSV